MLSVRLSVGSLVMLSACGFSINTGTSIDGNTGSDSQSADADLDDAMVIDGAPIDMPTPTWSTPVVLPGIPAGSSGPTLSGDTLKIWYERGGDLYVSSRPTTAAAFGAESIIVELSTLAIESSPEVAADGSSMTFTRLVGNNDLFFSTWDGNTWAAGVALNDLNGPSHDQSATISTDGTMLAMSSNRATNLTYDIFISTRNAPSGPWSQPVVQAALNSGVNDTGINLSGDKLTACFDSNRVGIVTHDIFCATRTSTSQPFGAPMPISDINSAQNDRDPWLSPDGKAIVFVSDRDGVGKFYYSTRP